MRDKTAVPDRQDMPAVRRRPGAEPLRYRLRRPGPWSPRVAELRQRRAARPAASPGDPEPPRPPRSRACPGQTSLSLLLLLVLGCGPGPRPLPEGVWIAGSAEAFTAALDRLATLRETPLGKLAAAARQRLHDCPGLFAGNAPEPALEPLFGGVECRREEELPAALEALRAGADLVLVAKAGRRPLVGRGQVREDGSVHLEIELPEPEDPAWRPLLPAAEEPGPPWLNGRETLLHGRLRTAGLDLSDLVPKGTAGDRLFKLRSRVFSELVLTGTWELALYQPRKTSAEPAGEHLPPLVVALGVRSRAAAAAAMETFLKEIDQVWHLTQRPFSLGSTAGTCLGGLRILPGLAPCWVATDDALVMSWNVAALRHALDPAGDPAALGGFAESHVVAALDRFPETERRLSRTLGQASQPQVYPWERLVLTGRRVGEVYRLELSLTSPSHTSEAAGTSSAAATVSETGS